MSPSLNYLALQWAFKPDWDFVESKEDYLMISDIILGECADFTTPVESYVSHLDGLPDFLLQCVYDSLLSVCVDSDSTDILTQLENKVDINSFKKLKKLKVIAELMNRVPIVHGELHPLVITQMKFNKIPPCSRRYYETDFVIGKIPFLVSRRKYDDSGVKVGVMANHPMMSFFMAIYGK